MILQLDSLYEPIFVQRQCPYGEALILALNIESIPVVFCCGSTQSSLWGGINSGTEDRIYNSHILLLIATPQQIAAPQNKSQCVLMPLQWGRLWIWPGYSGPAYLLCTMWYTRVTKTRTNYRCRWLKPRQAQQSTFPSWPCLTKGGFGNREGQHAGLRLTRRRLIKQNASMNLHSCLLSFKHRSVIILINGGRATVSKLQMALASEYNTKPPWPRQRQIPLDKVCEFYQDFDNLLIVGFVVFS